MGAVSAPILANVGGIIVKEFKISFPEFALLNGWPLLATGFSACMYYHVSATNTIRRG